MSFFFQAEDGIRDLVRSRGLGDVYKRQDLTTRERVTIQTSPEACANCHGLINSLGFALENLSLIHI